MFFEPLSLFLLFFNPLSLWSRIFLSRNFFYHFLGLLLVVSVVLSRLGSSLLLFPSLVRLPSSVPVYLFLFWIPWVPGGHCLFPLPHFFGWSSVERILAVGSCCSDFRVIKVCLVGILPLFHSFNLPYIFLIMRTSSRLNRSSGLHIGGSSAEEPNLGQTCEGSDRPAVVAD